MIIRPYEEKDFPQIKKWGSQYGAEYQENQFPDTGFIIDGVAAYFMYATDSSCCWLENMIANKEVDKKTRDQALALLCEAILREAKSLGFKIAYATTDNFSVVKRAATLGCKINVSQFLITKDLGPSL